MLLNRQLQNVSFYENSMSLFLKSTPGILERCEMYFNILKNVLNCVEKVFDFLNIYYKDYWSNTGQNKTGYKSFWLDLIGEYLGISRNFIGKTRLTNSEFLIYIQATIQKYIFDGTRESLREAYYGTRLLNWDVYKNKKDSSGKNSAYPQKIQEYLDNIKRDVPLNGLGIQYLQGYLIFGDIGSTTKVPKPGYCHIISNYRDNNTNPLAILFRNGFLTIESLGIVYSRTTTDYEFYYGKYDNSKFYANDNKSIYIYK